MTRHTTFSALAVIFAVAAAIYLAARQPRSAPAPAAADASRAIDAPFVMFRTLAPAHVHGRLAMVASRAPQGTRHVAALACARVGYAAGRGLCLVEEPDGATVRHVAIVFDHAFAMGPRIALDGIPTRARVSPDGRRGAITVYGEEHGPDGEERLATRTLLVDLDTGRPLADLREFAVDGLPDSAAGPRDVASVAFDADPDRFYATLLTDDARYVVAGSLGERRLRVLVWDRASEALSPDGRRLIVKRVGERGFWQVLVLDLGDGSERPLDHGSRSIDDQVEWLDERRVVYHDAVNGATGIWALALDRATPPSLLVPDAYSPAVAH